MNKLTVPFRETGEQLVWETPRVRSAVAVMSIPNTDMVYLEIQHLRHGEQTGLVSTFLDPEDVDNLIDLLTRYRGR